MSSDLPNESSPVEVSIVNVSPNIGIDELNRSSKKLVVIAENPHESNPSVTMQANTLDSRESSGSIFTQTPSSISSPVSVSMKRNKKLRPSYDDPKSPMHDDDHDIEYSSSVGGDYSRNMEASKNSISTDLNTSGSGSNILKIDRHGRVIHAERMHALDSDEKEQLRAHNQNLEKWVSMIKTWGNYQSEDGTISEKLRKRARTGIPDAVRGAVYTKILLVDKLRAEHEEHLYDKLVKQRAGTGPWDEIIRRDIHRTNPEHVMFMQKDGLGQEALYHVLRAYSLYDTEVGYCQGMGSFVSTMLTYAEQETVFWMLVGLLKGPHNIREFYLPNLVGIRRSFFVFQKLLERHLEKVSKHLDKEEFLPPLYASRWFGTLCSDLPSELTLRIWDILIIEGPTILYQVGLAIMKLSRKQLLSAPFDVLNGLIKDIQKELDAEDVIERALKYSIKPRELQQYAAKFEEIEAKLNQIM